MLAGSSLRRAGAGEGYSLCVRGRRQIPCCLSPGGASCPAAPVLPESQWDQPPSALCPARWESPGCSQDLGQAHATCHCPACPAPHNDLAWQGRQPSSPWSPWLLPPTCPGCQAPRVQTAACFPLYPAARSPGPWAGGMVLGSALLHGLPGRCWEPGCFPRAHPVPCAHQARPLEMPDWSPQQPCLVGRCPPMSQTTAGPPSEQTAQRWPSSSRALARPGPVPHLPRPLLTGTPLGFGLKGQNPDPLGGRSRGA